MTIVSKRFSLTLTVRAKLYILMLIVGVALAGVSVSAIYGSERMAAAGDTLASAVRGRQFGSRISLLVEKQRGLVTGAAAELDLDRQAGLRADFVATMKAFEEQLSTAREAADPDTATVIDQISANLKPLIANGTQVLDFAGSFAQVQANELINGDYGASVNAISEQVGAMLEANRTKAASATAALRSARETMQATVIGAALAAAAAVLLFWLILVRTITARIGGLTSVMLRLAAHDLEAEVPSRNQSDEIGVMAGAVQVFKDNMIDADRTRDEQERSKAEAEAEKTAAMQRLANEFEASVKEIVQTV